jgi:hypothetical protein
MRLSEAYPITAATTRGNLLSGRSEVRILSWTLENTGIPLEIAIDFCKMEFLFYAMKSPLLEEMMAAPAKLLAEFRVLADISSRFATGRF